MSATTSKQPQELLKDNQELKDICCYLDDTRQRSKRLTQEWQIFGKYTASVLRNEVLEFETKISILQEKLEKLSKENAELRDLCLFLNQMTGSSGPPTTSTPGPKLQSTQTNTAPYAVHAACVTEVNVATLPSNLPRYMGFTGEARLEDSKQDNEMDGDKRESKNSDPKSYVAQLEQRLERLEQEKLELIKSLSAAHILATSSDENKDLQLHESQSPDIDIEPPPNIKAFVEFISDDKDIDQSSNAKMAQQLSSEEIMKLSTLVDVSHRLDAYSNSTLQPTEAAEIVALRALLNVSWEQLKNKHNKKKPASLPVAKTAGSPFKKPTKPLSAGSDMMPQQVPTPSTHAPPSIPPSTPPKPPPPPPAPSLRTVPNSTSMPLNYPPTLPSQLPTTTAAGTGNAINVTNDVDSSNATGRNGSVILRTQL